MKNRVGLKRGDPRFIEHTIDRVSQTSRGFYRFYCLIDPMKPCVLFEPRLPRVNTLSRPNDPHSALRGTGGCRVDHKGGELKIQQRQAR